MNRQIVVGRMRLLPRLDARQYFVGAYDSVTRNASGSSAMWLIQANGKRKKAAAVSRGGFLDWRRAAPRSLLIVMRRSVLGRPGSDLLFQVLRLSTIGAGEFNGRVRDGIGFRLPAKTTKPAKDRNDASWSLNAPLMGIEE